MGGINIRRFNLEEYLKDTSKEVITRDGRKVRVICTDKKGDYPIVALVEYYNGTHESTHSFKKDGRFYANGDNDRDLFFAPEKHEGWATIYGKFLAGEIFSTKEEAEEFVKRCGTKDFVAIAKIEWEE